VAYERLKPTYIL